MVNPDKSLAWVKLLVSLAVVGVVAFVLYKVYQGFTTVQKKVGVAIDDAKRFITSTTDSIASTTKAVAASVKQSVGFITGTSETSTLGTWLYDLIHPAEKHAQQSGMTVTVTRPGETRLIRVDPTSVDLQ